MPAPKRVTCPGPASPARGLMAAGVVGGARPPAPGSVPPCVGQGRNPALIGSELALRVGVDPETVTILDLGLRGMHRALREARRSVVLLVRVLRRDLTFISPFLLRVSRSSSLPARQVGASTSTRPVGVAYACLLRRRRRQGSRARG